MMAWSCNFSTSAALEIYELNLGDPDLEMQMVGSIASDCRFNRLVWGGFGLGGSDLANGTLIGGSDHGSVFFWNPANILNKSDPLVHKLDKHTGPVGALDLNPFQVQLLGCATMVLIYQFYKYYNCSAMYLSEG